VQPVPLPLLKFLSGSVLSTKPFFLWSMIFGFQTHRKVQVPFGSYWILNDSTGVLDVTKLLKTFEIGSLSSFSTLVAVV
jgi:hypothetical protein